MDAPNGLTYGTLEGLYSIANTAQVAIVESTSGSNPLLWSPARPPVTAGKGPSTRLDGALWDVSALSRAALARCPTARCAIDLMGYLAVSEGFYGGHGTIEEIAANGETLLVADPKEAWAFHVAPLPPSVAKAAGVPGADGTDRGAHSAVWVAQRVPDDHFAVVANRYIVRDVVEVAGDACSTLARACRDDPFRHSSNLFHVAEYLASVTPDPKPFEALPPHRRGVRTRPADGKRVVDWLVLFGGDLNVELAPYSNDRIWRVLSLFDSKTAWEWPPRTPLATDIYPFSTAPSRPLTRADFLTVARDVYRNASIASLDLTHGAAAGPYGDPSRYDVASPFRPPAVVLAAADLATSARSARAHQQLLMTLMAALHDGYRVDVARPAIDVQKLFYPAWWLEKVNYYGPKYYPCYGPCAETASRNALAISAAAAAGRPLTALLAELGLAAAVLMMLALSASLFGAGYAAGRRNHSGAGGRTDAMAAAGAPPGAAKMMAGVDEAEYHLFAEGAEGARGEAGVRR